MAWESRGESRNRYFYRSVRGDDGKVRKQYLGKGQAAQEVANQLAEAQAERAAAQVAMTRELARTQQAESETQRIEEQILLLLEAQLLVAGYHRRNYGPWRRRRDNQEN